MQTSQEALGHMDHLPHNLLFEVDSFFNETYDKGLMLSGTPEAKRRRARFYNLIQLFLQTLDLPGSIAECGCWMGLSSYLLCTYSKAHDISFNGNNFHIFDSFEGLNSPMEMDALPEETIKGLESKFGTVVGAFQADLAKVKKTLEDFPGLNFHKGWIPQVLSEAPNTKYRFVHIDVDLYEPTIGAITYFFPKLVQGGIIICDDYGSLAWPGAKRAIDEYCQKYQLRPLILSTGQAVIFNKVGEGFSREKSIEKIKLSLREGQS